MQKKIFPANERRDRENRKRFSLVSKQEKRVRENNGKKSLSASERRDRENRKRFSLRVGREKRVREKDGKKESLRVSGETERTERKRGVGAPLIGAITKENSNLADRALSKIVNLPAKNWRT